jgi:hypothetical protein
MQSRLGQIDLPGLTFSARIRGRQIVSRDKPDAPDLEAAGVEDSRGLVFKQAPPFASSRADRHQQNQPY